MKRKKPYIFITSLLAVLFFIIGVRYGQNVERSNKKIDYLLSLTPTQTKLSPTPVKITEYKTKRWGIRIKYPENLEIKESTNSPEILIKEKEATKSAK